eukprot:11933836-Ditylum_brightwellii.AAC.1
MLADAAANADPTTHTDTSNRPPPPPTPTTAINTATKGSYPHKWMQKNCPSTPITLATLPEQNMD